MTANEVINIIESVAPLTQQEGWDNSGLQIGQRETTVSQVLLCTDVTDQIIDEAISTGCQMVISHHPLLFHGLKTIEGTTRTERCVIRAIQSGLVIYSSHTAMDSYLHGVSGHIADKLGISNYHILSPEGADAGLGVIGTLPQPVTLQALLQKVKTTFRCPVIRYTERTNEQEEPYINTIAVCGGAEQNLQRRQSDKVLMHISPPTSNTTSFSSLMAEYASLTLDTLKANNSQKRYSAICSNTKSSAFWHTPTKAR